MARKAKRKKTTSKKKRRPQVRRRKHYASDNGLARGAAYWLGRRAEEIVQDPIADQTSIVTGCSIKVLKARAVALPARRRARDGRKIE